MKRWQMLVGVGLLIVLASSWVIARSAVANSREAAAQSREAAAQSREAADRELAARKSTPPQESVATKHFLEIGKIYNFNFVAAPGSGQQTEKCEVMEQPHDGWVKVRVREGASSQKVTVAWLNLNQLTYIVPVQKGD
jgi:hypothetical protein